MPDTITNSIKNIHINSNYLLPLYFYSLYNARKFIYLLERRNIGTRGYQIQTRHTITVQRTKEYRKQVFNIAFQARRIHA